MNLGSLCRRLDVLLIRLQVSIAKIVANGVVEERRILWDNTNRLAKRLLANVANVLTINENSARLDVVVAEQEPQDGALSATARPDDGDLLPGGDGEGEVLENRAIRAVAKSDVFEANLAALAQVKRRSVGLVLYGNVDLLQVEERLHVEQRLAQLTVD